MPKKTQPTSMDSGIRSFLLNLESRHNVTHAEGVLEDTPERVRKAWEEMTRGYGVDVGKLLSKKFSSTNYDELILVKDIHFTSVCEHHLFPFVGVAAVAYIPNDAGEICGLSKIARVVEAYACRLQVQERLTTQIGKALEDHLHPRGVAVVLQAQHGCMSCRGVRQPSSLTVTSYMSGKFRMYDSARAEVLSAIQFQRTT